MREQPDNIKTINLVSETAEYLHLFRDSVNDGNMPLVTQLVQTLVEFTGVSQARDIHVPPLDGFKNELQLDSLGV